MKKVWYFLKPIVCSYMVQYLLIVIGGMLFYFFKGDTFILINENDIYKYTVIGTIITIIPIVIYLYRKYKIKESKIKVSKLLLMIPLGLCISLFYNMLTIKFQSEVTIELNIILIVLYMVVLGPIFEEFVFRYVALRNAREKYSENVSVILVSFVFAMLHSGIFNVIYAFLIGVVLSYIYIKYKNIMYPIILHVSANLMSIFISEFNLVALIISFLGLILITLYLKKSHV